MTNDKKKNKNLGLIPIFLVVILVALTTYNINILVEYSFKLLNTERGFLIFQGEFGSFMTLIGSTAFYIALFTLIISKKQEYKENSKLFILLGILLIIFSIQDYTVITNDKIIQSKVLTLHKYSYNLESIRYSNVQIQIIKNRKSGCGTNITLTAYNDSEKDVVDIKYFDNQREFLYKTIEIFIVKNIKVTYEIIDYCTVSEDRLNKYKHRLDQILNN